MPLSFSRKQKSLSNGGLRIGRGSFKAVTLKAVTNKAITKCGQMKRIAKGGKKLRRVINSLPNA
jgi:hypothetical protein